MAQASDRDISWAWCLVELSGPLEAAILEEALQAVVDHHEILRTVFQRQPGLKTPFQVILEGCHFDWKMVDRTGLNDPPGLDQLLALDGTTPLDRGPALRVVLARLERDRHWLVLQLPALCADVFSFPVLVSETGRAYGAKRLGEPFASDAMQYADIVEWQNDLLQSDEASAGRQFWREYLRRGGIEAWRKCQLPFELNPAGAFISRQLASAVQAPIIDGFSIREVLLTSWILFLARTTGCADMWIGCEFDGRNHNELEIALGALAKCLPLSVRVETLDSFTDLLSRVHGQLTEIGAWQDCFSCSADQRPLSPFSFPMRSMEKRSGLEEWSSRYWRRKPGASDTH